MSGESLRSPTFLKGFRVATLDNSGLYFYAMINFKGTFCFENNKCHKVLDFKISHA